MVRLPVFKGVENVTLLGVQRGQLQHIAALHMAHGDIVIKVDGARLARRNAHGLEAGLGKHQHLRIRIHIQGLEQAGQIAPLLVVVQLCLAGGELAIQQLGGIVGRRVGVIDGRQVGGDDGVFSYTWMAFPVRLRIHNGKVQTSHGAEVSVREARKLLQVVDLPVEEQSK